MKKSKRIRRCRIPQKNRGNKISPVGNRMSPLDLVIRIAEKRRIIYQSCEGASRTEPFFSESMI